MCFMVSKVEMVLGDVFKVIVFIVDENGFNGDVNFGGVEEELL